MDNLGEIPFPNLWLKKLIEPKTRAAGAQRVIRKIQKKYILIM